jgi:tetratricopeptide (TPR) repeat protein
MQELGMTQLSEAQQTLLRRLSVFAGNFSREAMLAVSTDEHMTQKHAIDLLDQLVNEGVIAIETDDLEEARYRLPEEVRTMAHAQLTAHGEADVVYNRIFSFYSALAEQVLQEAFGPQRVVWMERLEREHASLHALLTWLVAHHDAERGLQLAYLLQELWFEETHTSEGRAWFATLLALPQAAARTILRAQALDFAGALALNQGDYGSARELKAEGLSILRDLGDPVPLSYSLLHMGHLVGYAQGDLQAARALYEEALDRFRELSHVEGTAHALANLGTAIILLGDYATARPLVNESLRIYQELGFEWDMALSLGRAAGIAAGTNQNERALRLAGASAAHCARIGVSLPQLFHARHEKMIEHARRTLDEATQEALWREGQEMPMEKAVSYALEETSKE